MHQGGRIVSPGSLMEFFNTAGICNSVLQLILYFVKNILIALLVCGKVFLQFFDNPGTDRITGRGIEWFGGVCKMQ